MHRCTVWRHTAHGTHDDGQSAMRWLWLQTQRVRGTVRPLSSVVPLRRSTLITDVTDVLTLPRNLASIKARWHARWCRAGSKFEVTKRRDRIFLTDT